MKRSGFAIDRVFRLAQKELREILRDRRTIVTLIAMPLLLYPLMSVAFVQFRLAGMGGSQPEQKFPVGTLTEAEGIAFKRRIDHGLAALEQDRAVGEDKVKLPRFEFVSLPKEPHTQQEREEGLEKLKELLRDGKLVLVVVIPDLKDAVPNRGPLLKDRFASSQVIYLPTSADGRAALEHVELLFAAANEKDLKDRLEVPPEKPHITMLHIQRIALKTDGTEGIVSLAALVPLILILMTITGAVYPAIDLTAGERERGTLEILIAAPVSRFELLAAKYVSVVAVAVLNAVVNLLCMSITVSWSGLGATVFGSGGLTFFLLLQIFALLLLFAGFFSAVLLCITSFARSFKEAQAYLIPLMLASLTPGVLAMMPGLKLGGVLAVLPLVNIVLLTRDLFESGTEPISAAIVTVVIVTTLLYAIAALSLAARVFGAESVLYSEQSSWSDLMRRPDAPQATATVPAALWCLALMVPLQFALMAGVRPLAGLDYALMLALSLLVNLLLFGALPSLFIYLGRVELRSGLGLALPHPAALVGAVLLGLSIWPLELYALSFMQSNVSATLRERFGDVFQGFQRLGWFAYAPVIVPAILEEAFFRGFLFQAIRPRASAWVTIVVTGLLFGIAHIVMGGVLGMERLLPSAMLGLILSTVCWRTGSLWPSMIQHVIHNTVVLAVGLHGLGATEQIPTWWLAVGGAGVIIGIGFIWCGSSRTS
jgi:sodium transport system permease protein